MEGNFMCGFFDMIFDENSCRKNKWYKMSYYKFLDRPMKKFSGDDEDEDDENDGI